MAYPMRTVTTPRGIAMAAAAAWLTLAAATPAAAAVTLDHTSDMAFGTIGNITADRSLAESVCAGGLLGGTYSVTATGSGTGGAFTMAGGSAGTLAYEVQWATSANQTSGMPLTANQPLGGLSAAALNCTLGLVNNASLIVILRGTALSGATADTYSGTLSIMLAPN